MHKPLMIGIAGGSGSGKTTITRQIQEKCLDVSISILQLDHYYRDLSHLPTYERDNVNFDHPHAIEMDLLNSHIIDLAAGKSIDRPTYDFSTHTRGKLVEFVKPQDIVIIDGIFALYSQQIREQLDCAIYVDVSDDVRFIRRLRRDVEERGRTNEGVIKQYLATVKPMHDQFVAPTKYQADLVIQWDHYNARTIEMLAQMIRTSVSRKPAV